MNVETITDEGFPNNPYRSVRYADVEADGIGRARVRIEFRFEALFPGR